MEDLATLEISRAQTWQWLYHGITLDSGETVNKELIKSIFKEELATISKEIKQNMTGASQEKIDATLKSFEQAKRDAENLFTQDELADFLSTQSDLY